MAPILLLKTKSAPKDAYAEYFTEQKYTPTFVPVLEHDFHAETLQTVKQLFESGSLGPDPRRRKYGGIIFTSQRAVEGFANVVSEIQHDTKTSASKDLLLYTVGPATSRSLSALITPSHLPHATIHGEETGNGENLAQFILEHYNKHHPLSADADSDAEPEPGSGTKPPLLFLVGEQRRDVIPRVLTSEAPEEQRIGVEELTVYGTRVREDFEGAFRGILSVDNSRGEGESEGDVTWVVVFSPTGCEAMLRVLQQLKDNGSERKVYVATIGPTTRDHLRTVFGFEPHVCAEKPSAEGVGEGIRRFIESLQ